MFDLDGTTVTDQERELLAHPATFGVILFSRNDAEPAQLRELTTAIRNAANHPIVIAVDQEGGRVQRLRQGLTRLPAAAQFGQLYQQHQEQARQAVTRVAWLAAMELRQCGIDFSFAPVLDLDYGCSRVIGDRAFSAHKQTVSELGLAWLAGLREAGMAGCGKHFPGHGAISADSHHELPQDQRPLTEILNEDGYPFQQLIAAYIEAIMPAHVIYPQVDTNPAGFSQRWLQDQLRKQMGFDGAIISDDLSMQAARVVQPSIVERAACALDAGCDLLLVCNDRQATEQLLDHLQPPAPSALTWQRLAPLTARAPLVLTDAELAARQQQAQQIIASLLSN
jgi:beta-N-acetylhexosaminidase